MTSLVRFCVSVSVSGILALGMLACQKTETAEADAPSQKGPAAKVGEHIDKAAAEAAKHLGTMAEHAGKGLEKAGESLQKKSREDTFGAPAGNARTQESQN